MTKGWAEHKIKGGKLIQCEIDLEEGKLSRVRFYGDFFMHPETAVEELENRLEGMTMDQATVEVEKYFSHRQVKMFGVSVRDFSNILNKAANSRGDRA